MDQGHTAGNSGKELYMISKHGEKDFASNSMYRFYLWLVKTEWEGGETVILGGFGLITFCFWWEGYSLCLEYSPLHPHIHADCLLTSFTSQGDSLISSPPPPACFSPVPLVLMGHVIALVSWLSGFLLWTVNSVWAETLFCSPLGS